MAQEEGGWRCRVSGPSGSGEMLQSRRKRAGNCYAGSSEQEADRAHSTQAVGNTMAQAGLGRRQTRRSVWPGASGQSTRNAELSRCGCWRVTAAGEGKRMKLGSGGYAADSLITRTRQGRVKSDDAQVLEARAPRRTA